MTNNSNFTPNCHGGIDVTGVSTSSTAYNWFATLGNGPFAAAISDATFEYKTLLVAVGELARFALYPLVQAEILNNKLVDTYVHIGNIRADLDDILSAPSAQRFQYITKYNSDLKKLNNTLNSIKDMEKQVYKSAEAIDTSSKEINNSFSSLVDPAILGNGGKPLPSITTKNKISNAAYLKKVFSYTETVLNDMEFVDNYGAIVSMSAKNIFDLYCMQAQGLEDQSEVSTRPGIDYALSVTGDSASNSGGGVIVGVGGSVSAGVGVSVGGVTVGVGGSVSAGLGFSFW